MQILGMNNRDIVSDLVKDTYLPPMFKARQEFPRPCLPREEIPRVIEELIGRPGLGEKIKPGMRIAVTVGSRGISNIALITKSIVDTVKKRGARPFIVPAMGSHGGATAEGQLEVVRSLGVTEEYVGCPIISSMEVAEIGRNEEGKPVYIDKQAAGADGIILNCRIKPHTCFRGKYESGIMKMMAIGLGKQHGAEACHREGFKNMAKNVYLYGKVILEKAPILFAVASIENAYDETAKLVAVDAGDIEQEEPGYLKEAFGNMPRILFDSCDVLVVDQIGKNYSGDGMDPNITGTFCTPYATGGIRAQRVAVLDLSEASHGNAIGVGESHATTDRLIAKTDPSVMYPNAITSTILTGIRIPMVMKNDREAIQICVKSCNEIDYSRPRIVRIKNSLDLDEIWLSEAYYEEAKHTEGITVLTEPAPMDFDGAGNLELMR